MPVEAVGAYLRDMRERRGISLDEVSRQTRVPFRYLEALESDRLADLPAPVFVRGFIRAYCHVLGAPAEQALARLDPRAGTAVLTRAPVVRRGSGALPASSPQPRSRTRAAVAVSFGLLVLLGAALFSLTMVVHPRDDRRPTVASGESSVSDVEQAVAGPPAVVEDSSATAPADATRIAPVVHSGPSALGQPAPPGPRPSPTVAAPPRPAMPAAEPQADRDPAYRLVARATEATWIRVRIEDGRTTEETVPAGAVREWVSNRPFVLTVGNAGGIRLELNGAELPPLGASGAVISRLVVPAEPR